MVDQIHKRKPGRPRKPDNEGLREKFPINFTKKMRDELEEIALMENRSLSDLIRECLDSYIKRRAKQTRMFD